MRRVFLLLQFLPLSLFVAAARSRGMDDHAWAVAFEAGGALAAGETVLLLALRKPLSRLLLGANTFLAVGGVGFFLHVSLVLSLYAAMKEAALFGSIVAVGLVTTLFSRRGFVGSDASDRSEVRRASWILLVAAAAGMIVSMVFRGNVWLAGTLPFVLLVLVQRHLLARLALHRPTLPTDSGLLPERHTEAAHE